MSTGRPRSLSRLLPRVFGRSRRCALYQGEVRLWSGFGLSLGLVVDGWRPFQAERFIDIPDGVLHVLERLHRFGQRDYFFGEPFAELFGSLDNADSWNVVTRARLLSVAGVCRPAAWLREGRVFVPARRVGYSFGFVARSLPRQPAS